MHTQIFCGTISLLNQRTQRSSKMEQLDRDAVDLKKFMDDRWLTLGDLAELLIMLCEEQGRPVDHVMETGKLYFNQHQ